MRTMVLHIPPGDAWIVARLCQILSVRLAERTDAPKVRKGLIRMLFGLQRLPVIDTGVTISVTAGQQQIQLGPDQFSIASFTYDWQTEFRLQFFSSEPLCMEGFESLDESDRREPTSFRLDDFADAMEDSEAPGVEDLSSSPTADRAPLNAYLEDALAQEKP